VAPVAARGRVARARVESAAKVVAVLALVLAVVSGFQWGNRWYIATQMARSDVDAGNAMVAHAHGALVQGLALLVVAGAAAVVGWRVRGVARR
jgi:Ni/Fe-hydrogenase subunit HybB-like protein